MKSVNILVVEDDAIIGLNIKTQLQSMGYNVKAIAFSGDEAIRLSEELHPDLVLMDINIQGDMDGIEAAKIIKKQYNIPAIYITANTDTTTIKHIIENEYYGYIVKPVSYSVLLSTIEMAMKRIELENKLQRSEKLLRLITELTYEYFMYNNNSGNNL